MSVQTPLAWMQMLLDHESGLGCVLKLIPGIPDAKEYSRIAGHL